jgi:aldose 1-epimerase
MEVEMNIEKHAFGKTARGTPVDLYTLVNANGIEARISNYGGIVVSLTAPDRNGKREDVVLGFDTLEEYVRHNLYFGCIVGRYANRIAKGKFTLNGIEYTLAQNDGENHLHGGIKGFDKVIWEAASFEDSDSVGLKLTYLSEDGEEGYPGNLSVTVTYSLTNNDELRIEYLATTDQDTIVNLTNHSYFNLRGAVSGDILRHELMINADTFTPSDQNLIPTGELRSVEDTPMDFRRSTVIGARIDQDYEQLLISNGYDQNWVLNNPDGSLTLAARVCEPTTGRVLEVHTTEPGIQFYTGNFLNAGVIGKAGQVYDKHHGLCLEAQHFPDSPNKPNFPTTVLKPGAEYRQTTLYKFATK